MTLTETELDRMIDDPSDGAGYEFEDWCREAMAELATKWKSEGRLFSWFSDEPDFAEGSLCWFWIDEPAQPCNRVFRFSMVGGGQVTVTERWRWHRSVGRTKRDDDAGLWTWRDDWHCLAYDQPRYRLTVTAHHPTDLTRHKGYIDGYTAECSADAVIFGPRTPQEIADRAAATLRLTAYPDAENFYALLDSSHGCAICNRPLRDEVSKLIGVGPDCARNNGIPHNMEAANRRLKLRRELLGETPDG